MTADGAALLAAVVAAPDSDLPRLVYADWLDDHGRPERAELIRVQLGLLAVRGTGDRAAKARLGRRLTTLLRDHADGWRKELPTAGGRLRWGNFRRGFPDVLHLNAVSPDPPDLFAALSDAVGLVPVRTLEVLVRDLPAGLRVLDWPDLHRVPDLHLVAADYTWATAGWGPELADRLTTREWGRQPTTVTLRYWHLDAVPPAVWERLAGRPGPVFKVEYCWWVSHGEPAAVAASGGRVQA